MYVTYVNIMTFKSFGREQNNVTFFICKMFQLFINNIESDSRNFIMYFIMSLLHRDLHDLSASLDHFGQRRDTIRIDR